MGEWKEAESMAAYDRQQKLPSWRLKNLIARVRRARRGRGKYVVTCPASRHVQGMAENLATRGKDFLLETEPRHCAGSMLVVVSALWKARAELAELKAKGADQP